MVALISKEFFLTEMVGRKVSLNSERIGKLADLVIVESGPVPEVSLLVIHRPFGYPALLVPWDKVVMVTGNEIVIDIESLAAYEKKPEDFRILLKDYIVDKKVLDLDDNEVEIVFDVKLVARDGKLYASAVDLSRTRILRRLGLKKLADYFSRTHPDMMLSWVYIQPLPEQIGSFKGHVKLKVLKENLADIHPVDLADILEELDQSQRLVVFEQLEDEHASDTLEEVEPRVQRELISSIKVERAVELINQMTPGQAHDILDILPAEDAQEILGKLDPELAAKISYLLREHEETAALFMTQGYIAFSSGMIVHDVLEQFRQIARDKDVIMYVYVVDADNHLQGVVDLKELLQADAASKLEDIMVTHITSFKAADSLAEIAEAFGRYSFRAIPVTDEEERMIGVIPYRDVMDLKHRFA